MILPRRNWSKLLGSTLVLIAGIVGVSNPQIASSVVVALLGASLMISGALRIGFYLSGSKLSNGWDMFTGLLEILGAFFILSNGGATTGALTALIGVYVIIQGLLGLILGLRARNMKTGRFWWIGVSWGAITIVLGLLIVIFPVATAVGMGLLVGCHMIILGLIGIARYFSESQRHGF